MLKQSVLAAAVLFAVALPVYAQDNQPMQPGTHTPPSPEVRAAMQAMRQACAPDVANFCKDVQPGGGNIRACLKDHRAALSPGCTSAWQNLRAARKGGGQ